MFIKIDKKRKCIACGKETAEYMCIEGPDEKIKIINFMPQPWCENCIKKFFPDYKSKSVMIYN